MDNFLSDFRLAEFLMWSGKLFQQRGPLNLIEILENGFGSWKWNQIWKHIGIKMWIDWKIKCVF